MAFVPVEHPLLGRASVPDTRVPHLLEKGWSVVDDVPAPAEEPKPTRRRKATPEIADTASAAVDEPSGAVPEPSPAWATDTYLED